MFAVSVLTFTLCTFSFGDAVIINPVSNEPLSRPTYPDHDTGVQQAFCPEACFDPSKTYLLVKPVYIDACCKLWNKGYCLMDQRFAKKCIDSTTTANSNTEPVPDSTCPPCPEPMTVSSSPSTLQELVKDYISSNGTNYAYECAKPYIYWVIILALVPAAFYGVKHIFQHYGSKFKEILNKCCIRNNGQERPEISPESLDDSAAQEDKCEPESRDPLFGNREPSSTNDLSSCSTLNK